MIKAGIIGSTGYAGNELVRLLIGHKEVEIKWFGSRSYIDKQYADVYQNMFEIVAAHGITYAATASIGYLPDFMKKVEKAASIRGTKYIHIIAPCPTGWGIKTEDCVEIAKEVVDCGLWYLAEFENGEYKLNRKIKEFSDVATYIKKQGRFKHLSDEDIQLIEASRDKKWNYLNKYFN